MGMFDNEQQEQKQEQEQKPMNYDTFDPHNAVGNAETQEREERSPFAEPGSYPILFLDTLTVFQGRNKIDYYYKAVFDILESRVQTRPAGTRLTWMQSLRHDFSAGEVRLFLAALMNIDPEEVDPAGSKYACSDANPCHGRLIRLEAAMNAKGTFTKHYWHPVPKEVQLQAKELREKAGFPPF